MFTQPTDQFTLGAGNTGKVPEELEVFVADICDQAVRWLEDIAQIRQFTEVICTDLDDSTLMSAIQAKKGMRDADMVVEISFGAQHLVAFGEDPGNHVFCRSLTIAPGDCQNWNAKPPTVETGQIAKSP